MAELDVAKELAALKFMLYDLDGSYDVDGFLRDLLFQVSQLDFYYNEVAATGRSMYVPKTVPPEHTVAYFNLTRGFPKELHGGHWCYVYKHIKNKCIIIPTTSVKDTSPECDTTCQIDIRLIGFNNNKLSRLQVSDIRSVDWQRLYNSKPFYNVAMNKDKLRSKIDGIITG